MLYAVLYLAVVAGCIVLDLRTGVRRPLLAVALPLLMLDCAANCLVFFQSWRNTMSGELWNHDQHPVWHRVRVGVDRAFFWQVNHCQYQCIKEAAYGGFWPALAADWKRSK